VAEERSERNTMEEGNIWENAAKIVSARRLELHDASSTLKSEV